MSLAMYPHSEKSEKLHLFYSVLCRYYTLFMKCCLYARAQTIVKLAIGFDSCEDILLTYLHKILKLFNNSSKENKENHFRDRGLDM